jgi:hypothetical protein
MQEPRDLAPTTLSESKWFHLFRLLDAGALGQQACRITTRQRNM